MKIRPMEAELFSVDRQTDGRMDGKTDIMKLISAFRNFMGTRLKTENTIMWSYITKGNLEKKKIVIPKFYTVWIEL